MEQASKRRRYSLQPDLEVEVEGQVFHVHSSIFMLASPVFRGMLESGMSEAEEGLIRLPGKLKDEFIQILPFFSTVAETPSIALEAIPTLLRWAHEYDIQAIRKACEQELLKQEPSVEHLQLAVHYGLPACRARCLDAITSDLQAHVDALGVVADDTVVMGLVAPAIFNATNVLGHDVKVKRLPSASLRMFWPLIRANILDSLDQPFASRPHLSKGEVVRVLSSAVRLQHLCEKGRTAVVWNSWMTSYAGQQVIVVGAGFHRDVYRVVLHEVDGNGAPSDCHRLRRYPVNEQNFRGRFYVEFPYYVLCPLAADD